jgi:WD40 repeat protein
MVTLSTEGILRTWRLNSYDRASGIPWSREAVFSGDGKTLALFEWDAVSTIETGSGERKEVVSKFDGDSFPIYGTALASSEDGQLIARRRTTAIWVVDARAGQRWQLQAEADLDSPLAFSADGKLLAMVLEQPTSAPDSAVQLWDLASRRKQGDVIRGPKFLRKLAFSPNGKRLAMAASVNQLMLWDVERDERAVPSLDASGELAAFVKNGTRLVARTRMEDNGHTDLRVWNLETGAPEGAPIEADIGEIRDIVVLDEGVRVLLVSWSSVVFWDLQSNTPIGAPLEVPGIIKAATVTARGRQLLVATESSLYTWELAGIGEWSGRDLAERACRVLVPGKLSRLTPAELKAAPILDPRFDGDACHSPQSTPAAPASSDPDPPSLPAEIL